jgi:hypothetical protein
VTWLFVMQRPQLSGQLGMADVLAQMLDGVLDVVA